MEPASELCAGVELFIAHSHCARLVTRGGISSYDAAGRRGKTQALFSIAARRRAECECDNVILYARNRRCRTTAMQCECALRHFVGVSSIEFRHYYTYSKCRSANFHVVLVDDHM